MYFFDPNYFIFMIPAFILMAITSGYVRSSYKKWSQVRVSSGLTGGAGCREADLQRRPVWRPGGWHAG